MRSFNRRLRYALTALCAAACVIAAVLWVRSHFVRDYAWFVQPWTRDDAAAGETRFLWFNPESHSGQLSFTWRVITRGDWTTSALAGRRAFHASFPSTNPAFFSWASTRAPWERLGFGLSHPGLGNTCVYVPYWFVTLALAIPPGLAARRWRSTRRRASEGRCPTCGYDLRATPDRCPECGTPAALSVAEPGTRSPRDGTGAIGQADGLVTERA